MTQSPDSEPGTYAIIYHCPRQVRILVGSLGELRFNKGYYIYVGSAFGPGGVRARVMRHQQHQEKQHWHVDYLSEKMTFVEAWYTHDTRRLEHAWAELFGRGQCFAYPRGFGSSDCKCYSHLFVTTKKPDRGDFLIAPTRGKETRTVVNVWKAP